MIFPQLLRNFPHFMESRNSLSYLQFIAACRCRDSDKSNLHSAYILKIRFNILLTFIPRSFEWPLSFRISLQRFVLFHFSPIYVTCSATHLPLIDRPNNIKWREHIMSPRYAYSLVSCCYLLFLPLLNAVERMLLNHKIKMLIFHFWASSS
jgi:hypothetical protein